MFISVHPFSICIDSIISTFHRLKAAGIHTPKSSIGSTPSCSHPVPDMAMLSEVHPGNYVFYGPCCHVLMFNHYKQWCSQFVWNHNIICCTSRRTAVPYWVLQTWGCCSTGTDAGHRSLSTQEPVTCRLWVGSTESWWWGALTHRIRHHWRTPGTQVRDHYVDLYEGWFIF